MSDKQPRKGKKRQASPRSRGWMYVQQLQHLPFDNVTALLRRVATLKQLARYAALVHDHDTNAAGEPVAPHEITRRYAAPERLEFERMNNK